MTRRRWTHQQRDEALALMAEHGASEASRRTGIPSGTIASWAHRTGVSGPEPAKLAAATATRLQGVAERKTELASNLIGDAERLRAQLFAPVVEKKAMTVSGGHGSGSNIEVAEVDLSHPVPADQKRIAEALAVLLEKALLLLGDATERVEQHTTSTAPVERRQAADGVLDELAARRKTS